jgi:hypothetical protein
MTISLLMVNLYREGTNNFFKSLSQQSSTDPGDQKDRLSAG